jgi:hypothetical protein
MKAGIIIALAGGAIGLIAGVGVAVATTGLWGLLFAVPFVLVFAWIYLKFLKPIFSQSRLLKTGEPATATVLELKDSNMTINENPVVKLKLRIQPKAGAPYEAEVKTMINRLQTGYYQPGSVLSVKVDPNRPESVAVEGVSPQMPTSQEMRGQTEEMLRQLSDRNNEILATGIMAQATIIHTWPMNISVNGSNPLMGFWLKVIPEGEAPFEAEAKGAVGNSAIAKFRPGATIWVKYDAGDHSRVTIWHS